MNTDLYGFPVEKKSRSISKTHACDVVLRMLMRSLFSNVGRPVSSRLASHSLAFLVAGGGRVVSSVVSSVSICGWVWLPLLTSALLADKEGVGTDLMSCCGCGDGWSVKTSRGMLVQFSSS